MLCPSSEFQPQSLVFRQEPAESRIPVFLKHPSAAPSHLSLRGAFTLRSHNDKTITRPSSLLELFGRNKVAALPSKPMSVASGPHKVFESTPDNSQTSCSSAFGVRTENVRNCDAADEGRCWRDGPVTAAHLGHRVSVSRTKVGILRYFGEIEQSPGVFCGVELDEPVGLNDGSVEGVRYFTCRPQHGIIAPVGNVRTVPGGGWQEAQDSRSRRRSETFILDESGPYSLLEGLETTAQPTDEDVDCCEMQQPSAVSTPTPSSPASNAAPWECSASSLTSSHTRYQSHPSQQSSVQGSFEQDESSLGVLTPDQVCPVSALSRHQSQLQTHAAQQLSKQNSFELDESLGILTPDQMIDFTVCADSTIAGRTPSFEDMDVFLLGDFKGDRAEDLLPDRLPSESDGPSSSNYPSSEFPQFPDDAEKVTNADNFLLSKTEDHQLCTPNTVTCMSEDLSDNVCPAVSKSSGGDFRVGQDISDRTLSPEDLPMDAPFQEVMGEILQKSDVTSEGARDTAGLSGATSAGPSSRSSAAPPAGNSFVTSVTSITSLDNGYQGDGEWSRPASRGADHSPTNHRVVKPKTSTADPMTDSDFFTESDADMHDELAAGSSRGDRRAQVIDGTLYGANLHTGGTGHQHQRCPSFTASINEEMESSGVYSDLERRPEDAAASDEKAVQGEDRNPAEGDLSPDASTKTVSSRSEQSQVKESVPVFTTIIEQVVSESIRDLTSIAVSDNNLLAENNLKNQRALLVLNPVAVTGEPTDLSSDKPARKTDVTPLESPGIIKSPTTVSGSSLVASTGSKSFKDDGSLQPKKFKMPKRNVASKIKAMIESSSPSTGVSPDAEDENQENRRPTRAQPKTLRKNGGRWDAVMSKIAQGQAEQKLKPRSLKEVKSKVFANLMPPPTQQTEGAPRRGAERTRKTVSSNFGPSASSRALKENSPLKTKSRRARTRASSSSLCQQQQQQQAGGNGTAPGRGSSRTSSLHSSVSDVSVSQRHVVGNAKACSKSSSSSLRSSKKHDAGRSTSPLSDGSSTSHVMTNSSSNHLVNHARTTGQKKGVGVTAVADMKTPSARKQASRRNTTNSTQKPTPLRDHNRQHQADGVFKSGGESSPSNKPGEVSAPSQRPPAAQPQPTPVEILLLQLRHNSAGFEALGVLVQYLVYNLDAFSTPQLRKNLQSMKTEWIKTKLELEEAQVSYRRMEDKLKQENVLHLQRTEEIKAASDRAHSREVAELVARHEAELSDFDKRLREQLEEMRGRHEAELSRAEKLNVEKLEVAVADGKVRLEQVQHEHVTALTRLQRDTSEREAELKRRLASVEEEYSGLKDQSRKLMESMQKDKDTKLQVTAGHCKELQDEVGSLRTVLDLRRGELQELRKQNALLTREAEELPVALQRVAALEAKVEDLQVQLQVKTNLERQLSQDKRVLMESFHKESKQNKRLSLHNEELQWKLKQNVEVVNVLAALSGASMNSSMTAAPTNGRRSVHGSVDIDPSATRIPPRPLSAGRSQNISASDLSAGPATALGDSLETSPPASPKVKGVVEKSDSVSWVVEIDETSEDLLSRLVRRAGSLRGTTPPPSSSPSPAHARTLPPPKRQRCKASSLSLSSSATAIARPGIGGQSRNSTLTSSVRSRSRSMSIDSVEDVGLDYGSWNPRTSTPLQNSYGDMENPECEDDVVVLMNCNKSLKCCGDNDHEDSGQNPSSVIHNLSGVSNGTLKRGTSEFSNEEESPGSSGSSDVGQKDHDCSCYRSRKQVSGNLIDSSAASDSLDLGDPEVLPLPPLPGSTSGDLSLLAAQPLPPMPKESAGEAMISEETSEDENEDGEEVNSSSDGSSCSEDEGSSSSGSSSGLGPRVSRELMAPENGVVESGCGSGKQDEGNEEARIVSQIPEVGSGQQNMSSTGSTHQYRLLLKSESGSCSATTMDLSWSEDMELAPSESDG
ncbi:Microtubule plus-end tracking protein TIP150 [Zootermopsis nevadensis]|uniref:Microtubule plus-end tracking protein TIP150 n=3 Tax=Zootermopsis nevadensis TaxID=136037 RepID=A0A067RCV7_ZOONE|nr:Microtubule plus-end tracking protein TIP150 [Zootermopsis nevadensis]